MLSGCEPSRKAKILDLLAKNDCARKLMQPVLSAPKPHYQTQTRILSVVQKKR